MTTLVFFLEEPSAREMLQGLLPRVLPLNLITIRYVVFEGKQDLEKHLARRLRGWRTPDTRFVVLRDQDAADCVEVKRRLLELCEQASHPEALVRIACRELESWYLGDLLAVEQGLGMRGLARRQGKREYRDPDQLAKPSEVLERLTDATYQKVSGSRGIGPYLATDGANRSRSFSVFLAGIRRFLPSEHGQG